MNSEHRPFFSVLIPSYNRPEYIAECVESVLANEGEDYELILSDDASPSSDAIEQAMQPYLAYSNIRFHRQQKNLGEPGNRNFLVSQATGEYNLILCDDDKLLPHALRTIRQYIRDNPNLDLYGFGYTVIDEEGRPCYSRSAPRGFVIDLSHPELIRRMFEGTWLPFLVFHPATFCCKRGVEKEIPYREDVSTADDFMFLLDCVNQGKRMHVVPECLIGYRWFQSHETTKQLNQSSDSMKVMQAYTKVYYVLQQRVDLHPSIGEFISSSDYRKHFLYDPIIRRMQITNETMDVLKLQPAHREELAKYAAKPWRYALFLKSILAVALEMAQLFGLQGIIYSMRAGFAYLRYKVLKAWVASPG
jgi:glycosyltransferase involved in cell wall biosynthesis